MPRAPIRWLLVEWNDGILGVIHVKAVVDQNLRPKDMTTGKLISAWMDNKQVPAKIVMSSDDRKFLEMQIRPMTLHKTQGGTEDEPHPRIYDDPELQLNSPRNGDFSDSDSSWSAENWSESSEEESASEDKIIIKKIKSERVKRKYTRSKQTQGVIPKSWRINETSNQNNSSIVQSTNGITVHTYTTQTNIIDGANTTPRRQVMMYDQQVQTDDVAIPTEEDIKFLQEEVKSCQEIIQMTKSALLQMAPLFNIGNRLNQLNGADDQISNNNSKLVTPDTPCQLMKLRELTNDRKQSSVRKPVILNGMKADDHVQTPKILNSSLNGKINLKRKLEKYLGSVPSVQNGGEIMVPIGSGRTLVSKTMYDKINWKSYTMATRKLLMAVFPRNILATHSLTGKSSPAFQNKPPKLCLDPRKVSDIVMTVTQICNVKENLVRSAITVKCADENKMQRFQIMREQNAKKPRRIIKTRNSSPYSDPEFGN